MSELGIFHHSSLAATTGALRESLEHSGQTPVPPALMVRLLTALDALYANRHGDFPRWAQAVAALPAGKGALSPAATVHWRSAAQPTVSEVELTVSLLRELHPWRKGPFGFDDLHIDTEWRSDWKWNRVAPAISSALANQRRPRILDVGCGNGYFGWRLLEAGAACVIGIDPTLLFCMQHLAINRYARSDSNWVLPLRLEDLPAPSKAFDGVLSMGVLYHRRDPLKHLAALKAQLQPGGWLLLETLVTAEENLYPAQNKHRYARMRNVWCVPKLQQVEQWLEESGFHSVRCEHEGVTSRREQRQTEWMRFESLDQALDSGNDALTVEGWPRPRRAVFSARRPRSRSG